MALLILCDPAYRPSSWCDIKLRGISDEAARRRIPVKLFTDFDAFWATADTLDSDSSVILLFNSMLYLEKAGALLKDMAIHPILSVTESEISFPRTYSQVCGDVESATKDLVSFFRARGRRRIALLGTSDVSAAGRNKVEMLRRHASAEEYTVFADQGNLMQSFETFFSVRDRYDAIICTNDHQAVAFLEFLQARDAYDPSVDVVSHGDTILAKLYGNGISTVSTGFYACGKAMVESHVHRVKYGWSSAMVRVPCEFTERGSTSGRGVYPRPGFLPPHTNQVALGKLERLLADCDIANLKLLYGLLAGYGYEHMGELCFLSASAVKYRVQQIRTMLGCETRADVIAAIERYIQKERLLQVIENIEINGGKIHW